MFYLTTYILIRTLVILFVLLFYLALIFLKKSMTVNVVSQSVYLSIGSFALTEARVSKQT